MNRKGAEWTLQTIVLLIILLLTLIMIIVFASTQLGGMFQGLGGLGETATGNLTETGNELFNFD